MENILLAGEYFLGLGAFGGGEHSKEI